MALSYEYTFWHLTPNGWISGDSKTDFDRKSVDTPKDTVLTIRYEEKLNHPSQGVKTSIERHQVSSDLELIKSLEAKFPFKGHI
jgi:hypothetical protein